MRTLASLFVVFSLVVGLLAWTSEPAVSVDRAEVDRACAASERALQVVEDGAARLDAAVRRFVEINAELEERTLASYDVRSAADDKAGDVSGLRKAMNDRAVDLYMTGSAATSASILDSDSLTDFLTGRTLMAGITESDNLLAGQLGVEVDELLVLNETLKEQNAALDALRDEQEQLTLETNQALEAAQGAYFRLDTECARLYGEYQAEQRRLEAELLAGIRGGLPLEATPGFICPVKQPFSFINDWGFPRSGGRTHKGTDVFTPYGQEQYAVANGTVQLLSGGLGGIALWVKADYGVDYYYAHLSGYAPGLTSGQAIEIGDVVGFTGNSGNARTTPPHLHFGIKTSTGTWVTPYPTLARTCG